MSLQQVAKKIQSEGRGKDTVLVHMSPNEVAGLQALAKANGGSLTINPKTGLPEAGFLESILPALVGGALAVATGGLAIPILAGAATGAMMNEEDPWMGALTGGMGAFGGASLAGGAMAAGAAGAGTDAAAMAAAETAVAEAAKTAAAEAAAQAAAEAAAQEAIKQAAADQLIAQGAAQGFGEGTASLWGEALKANTAAGLEYAGSNAAQAGLSGLSTSPVSYSAGAYQGNTGLTSTAQTPPPATYSDKFSQFGTGAKNAATTKEGQAAFMKEVGGASGLKTSAMQAAVPYMYQQSLKDRRDARTPQSAREIMDDMKAGRAESNRAMDELGTDEEFRAAQANAKIPGQGFTPIRRGPGLQAMPWYYEERKAEGGVMTNAALIPSAGSSRDAGLGLAALAGRVRRWQAPAEMVAASEASAPMAAVGHQMAMMSASGGGGGGRGGPIISVHEQLMEEGGGGPGADAGVGGGGPGDDGTSPSEGDAGDQGSPWAKGGLADGGFVFPADVVSALGNGSTDAGLRALANQFPGLKPIKGAGDGLSDSIPAKVNGGRPARVADGEAYITPQVVQQYGGGNHSKGAKKLYAMLDKVRKTAHGKTTQQRPVKPERVVA